MNRTRIKICGITRVEDALLAARLGADAVGIIFHPASRRWIKNLDLARQIVTALPPFVTPVGLFVDEQTQVIRETIARVGVRVVQLHGDESPEQVAELREFTVLKAIRVNRETLTADLAKWKSAIADLKLDHLAGLVLETGGTALPGGTGVVNDWETIRRHVAASDFTGLPPLIAAGGLTPENVGEVVRALRPMAVDVSSGVESSIGIKSSEKVGAFVDGVRRADDAI